MKNLYLIFAIATLISCGGSTKTETPQNRADAAINTLQKWYNPQTSQWKTTSWWNAANIVTMLIRHAEVTKSDKNLKLVDEVFENCKQFKLENDKYCTNFINDFYDDEGWWALAWIDAYNLTKTPKYLEMVKVLFDDMATGHNNVCNGGIYWKKPQQYKNAIANGLFTLTAFRLYKATKDTIYRNWAYENVDWYIKSGMISESDWMVEDGLNDDCTTNKDQRWTYNQGVAIAMLCEAFTITNDSTLLQTAQNIADAAIKNMVTENGILKEKNEPDMGADGTQFKGIFIRHLALLYNITKKSEYKLFIVNNANSIWENARNKQTNELGGVWAGPYNNADASTQSSALDCLVEAINLK